MLKHTTLLLPLIGLLICAIGVAAEPIEPKTTIKLFNGRDLRGWYWHQKESDEKPTKPVYSTGHRLIRISGEGRGYLATNASYKNYHLSLEYSWGERTDGTKYVRNSGVLLHKIYGERVWPTSIEVQLAQGCEGDFIVIPGKRPSDDEPQATMTCETRKAADGKTRWQAGGTKTKYSGRQFWWSRHQVGFKELRDTRGKDDVASPLGEWTRVDCICRGNRITIKINGVTVNEAFDVYPSAGQILLQNEGSEVYFRNIELHPLPPLESNKP